MIFYALYHHASSYQEIKESELFALLSENGFVTPAILQLYNGSTVTTPKAQIYGILINS